jgi:hypothetical protein
MANIYQSISTFFIHRQESYILSCPKYDVIKRLHNLFDKNVSLLSDTDLTGSFKSESSFYSNLVSGAATLPVKRYSPTLYGDITEIGNSKTQIRTITKTSSVLYFLFIIAILCGFIFLFRFSFNGHLISNLLYGLGTIIIGPFFCIWFANISQTAIHERFEKFIKG